MHLSDSGIHTLEHAMAQARAATSTRKAGDAAALKALRGILKEVVVRPDDLPFGTVEPDAPSRRSASRRVPGLERARQRLRKAIHRKMNMQGKFSFQPGS